MNFRNLRAPLPGAEQIEVICKHALEKYAIALYGAQNSTVGDLLLCVHEVHSALSHHGSARVVTDKEIRGLVYCYSCHLPGVTVCSCPRCKPPARITRNPPGRVLEMAASRAEDMGSNGTMTFGGVSGHGPPDFGNLRGGGLSVEATLPPGNK